MLVCFSAEVFLFSTKRNPRRIRVEFVMGNSEDVETSAFATVISAQFLVRLNQTARIRSPARPTVSRTTSLLSS